jgi:hypothetical protein
VDRAAAYCRETLETPPSGPCVERPGVPRLWWKRPCTTYVFNDKFFESLPLLDEQAIRRDFHQSFDAWSSVDCGKGRLPFFVEQASGTTPTHAVEHVDQGEESVIVALGGSDWTALHLDAHVIAATFVWSDTRTSEIVDVDMAFNADLRNFADCASTCSAGQIDLRNTVTHEAGHVLGLGHSTVAGSTMQPYTRLEDTDKRTLEADDIAGYCSLELPSFACQDGGCVCPPPAPTSAGSVRSCGCELPGTRARASSRSAALLISVLAVLAALRRRRSSVA